MDSLLEPPRKPPVPAKLDKLRSAPIVPEVSLIANQNTKSIKDHNMYKTWKINKENLSGAQKHVHFNKANEEPCGSLPDRPKLQGKTFKDIYMANIPNRQLDLSILEPIDTNKTVPNSIKEVPKKTMETVVPPSPPQKVLNSYKDFRIENEFITDILNYRSPVKIPKNVEKWYDHKSSQCTLPIAVNSSTQTDLNSIDDSSEPSLKDLFQIIQQQNEQILQLQKQVLSFQALYSTTNQLVPKDSATGTIPRTDKNPFSRKGQNIENNSTERKLNPQQMPGFSIDLMRTSVEVSFRRPALKKTSNNKDFKIHEPKIREITDDLNTNNLSLRLPQSLQVGQDYLSPEPSIRINMDDYHSSDDDEDSSSDMGVTFYQNIMEQVNEMINNSTENSANTPISNSNNNNAHENTTKEMVKETTKRHLRSMGINLPDDCSTTNHSSEEISEDNMENGSFAVRQLLMKYLPNEQLVKLNQIRSNIQNKNRNTLKTVNNREKQICNPEFSIATVKYMRKYNLLNCTKVPQTRKRDDDNYLDITALKNHPKLM